MRYVKENKTYTIEEIRQENINMSIPDNTDCSYLGYETLIEVEQPKQDGFHAVEVAPVDYKQTWELREIIISDDEKKLIATDYLKETDWTETYKLRHDIGLEIIPEESSKWIIINKREEYKTFLRQSN